MGVAQEAIGMDTNPATLTITPAANCAATSEQEREPTDDRPVTPEMIEVDGVHECGSSSRRVRSISSSVRRSSLDSAIADPSFRSRFLSAGSGPGVPNQFFRIRWACLGPVLLTLVR